MITIDYGLRVICKYTRPLQSRVSPVIHSTTFSPLSRQSRKNIPNPVNRTELRPEFSDAFRSELLQDINLNYYSCHLLGDAASRSASSSMIRALNSPSASRRRRRNNYRNFGRSNAMIRASDSPPTGRKRDKQRFEVRAAATWITHDTLIGTPVNVSRNIHSRQVFNDLSIRPAREICIPYVMMRTFVRKTRFQRTEITIDGGRLL